MIDPTHKLYRFLRACKHALVPLLRGFGYDGRDWYRISLYEDCDRFLAKFDRNTTRVLAISSPQHFGELGFKHFTVVQYPEFDICRDVLEQKFDLIIADQVFEHVKYPYRAARNVHAMLAPRGYFLMATPFMVRLHQAPLDCCRWSAEGIRYFLSECGFDESKIVSSSWGNRSYIWRHFWGTWWPMRGFFGSLRNEPNFPVAVWAFAQK
jgi:SAM-dependent methyltransferase